MELRQRFQVINSEEVEQCFQEGQNVAAILGHYCNYCNWEWLSCVGIELPKSRKIGLIYHPLRNHAFDELFKRIRSHEENGVVVPKKEILRYLVDYKRKGIMSIFGYISDQGPKWENIHLWLPFLNHPVRDGIEAERNLQGFFMAYLYLSSYYITAPELELNHGYCDFFLLPDLTHYPTKHSYIIELKMLPAKDFEAKAEAQWQEAVEQINRYAAAPRIEVLRQGTTLHKIIIQFAGWEMKRMEEV